MEDELKTYGLHVEYSQGDAYKDEPISFEIRDKQGDLYATVWGSEPWHDVQIDCEHPAIEFDDDETQGECAICGATCTWHEVEIADGDGYTSFDRIPDDWTTPEKIGGIVGRHLKKLQEGW